MAAIEKVTKELIGKHLDQTRVAMETLQKTQTDMRRYEKELEKKDQLIKVMEDRIRRGSNTYLEMGNRQKDIAIKHLDLQIQELNKRNENLERQVILAKSDVCEKCETKYLMRALPETKPTSKPTFRLCAGKSASNKQIPETESQKREKMLERIIEHKDKRIFNLTKDIQKLKQAERELSNKIFRMTKLLPMSHVSTDVLTECLLKEIQSLELQLQHYQGKYNSKDEGFSKSISVANIGDPKSRTAVDGVDDILKGFSSSKTADTNVEGASIPKFGQKDDNMVSKLHLLYNDVVDLKQLFATENEKLFMNLSKETLRKDVIKSQWEEVIQRLNEIAKSIEHILHVNSQPVKEKPSDAGDRENVILRLQGRLKDALELTTQYENENAELRRTIEMLKDQLQRDRISSQYTQTDVNQPSRNSSPRKVSVCQSVDDAHHLKELLSEKQKQLESVESHLKTYQSFVEQLQGVSKESLQSKLQSPSGSIQGRSNGKAPSPELKLEVAEKQIKVLEDVIEQLQGRIRELDDRNANLSAASIHNASLQAKVKESVENLAKVQSFSRDLESSVHSLEERNSQLVVVNSKLEQQMLEAEQQQRSLRSKLDTSISRLSILETNLGQARHVIEELKEDNAELKTRVQTSESRKSLDSQMQQDEMRKLEHKLILKDKEIKKLNDSLQAIEMKALEMSHHRKALRQEIERLCDVLLEKADPNKSTENRKAIYKMAVLKSAKALLQLDEDYNVQPKTNGNGGAFNEMSKQASVYLTEVARIHELLTIKYRQREDILKDFFEDDAEFSHFSGQNQEGPSGVNFLPPSNPESEKSLSSSSSRTSVSSSKRHKKSGSSSSSESSDHSSSKSKRSSAASQAHQSPIGSKSKDDVTPYLLSKCSQLEVSLEKIQQEKDEEVEALKTNNADLQGQLKDNVSKLLNILIDAVKFKDSSDEIAMEQVRKNIQSLMEENRKVYEKTTQMQTELCMHKEDCARMSRDLDDLKRGQSNEKFDVAIVHNELRHLRKQILNNAALP